MRDDLARDVAGVDGVAGRHDRGGPTARRVRGLDRREAAEEIAELALHEKLADLRRPPVREEHRGARGPLTQAVLQHRDRPREPRVDREPVAELDRRREDLAEREPPVAREGGEPRVACGGRDRARCADRHRVPVLRAVRVEVERRRPPAEPVDRFGSGHPRAVDDDRRDAAEVREVPLEDVERDAGRDPCVDGAPAAREHPEPRERREVMARADHVLRAEDRGPALGDPDRWRRVLHRDLAHSIAR